jgi:hypothetical protein
MEFLSTAEIFIPVYQMILLLLVSTLTLLFGRTKLALIINYLFTLYCRVSHPRLVIKLYLIKRIAWSSSPQPKFSSRYISGASAPLFFVQFAETSYDIL